MMMKSKAIIFVGLSICFVLSACNALVPEKALADNAAADSPSRALATSVPIQLVREETTKTGATVNEPTRAPAAQPAGADPAGASGPDSFPAEVNPLTGLPVSNPENLNLPPALISITNFPVTARPQAGLSYSPFVFEMYIGEGMTRFLALFYGDFPKPPESTDTGNNSKVTVDYTIGPIRSGRLPYEGIRKQYGGFLVMASAWSGVASQLSDYTNVFGSDNSDINSAMIKVTDLEKIAQRNQPNLNGKTSLSAYKFDAQTPAGGKPGTKIWIPFSFLNQVIWKYDPSVQAYSRFQDDADGKTFIQSSDRLNGSPLAYSNVVILFANHQVKAETLIDIDLMYQNPQRALIFRDGQVYDAFWTTQNGDYEKKTGQLRPIRFVDAQGNPFPMKPGQTWVELVPTFTRTYETPDTEAYYDLTHKITPGSGNWAIGFYVPKK
jgi:hypothetical protein